MLRSFVFVGCASIMFSGTFSGAGVAFAHAALAQSSANNKAESSSRSSHEQQPGDDTGAYGGGGESGDSAEKTGRAGQGAAESSADSMGSASKSTSRLFDRSSYSVMAGGGVLSFTNGDTNDIINTGGAYQVRAAIGTRSMVGFEVAYIGSANDIDALGLDPAATVLGNGVEGAVRFNFSTTRWQPYVLAGAAWKSYSVINDDFNTSDVVNESDGVFEVPLAAGLTWHNAEPGENGLIADARFDFRLSGGDDLLGGVNGGGPGLENWTATVKAGYEF